MSIGICFFMSVVVWQSIQMLQEKKERWHKGQTDYYGNSIKKEEQK